MGQAQAMEPINTRFVSGLVNGQCLHMHWQIVTWLYVPSLCWRSLHPFVHKGGRRHGWRPWRSAWHHKVWGPIWHRSFVVYFSQPQSIGGNCRQSPKAWSFEILECIPSPSAFFSLSPSLCQPLRYVGGGLPSSSPNQASSRRFSAVSQNSGLAVWLPW